MTLTYPNEQQNARFDAQVNRLGEDRVKRALWPTSYYGVKYNEMVYAVDALTEAQMEEVVNRLEALPDHPLA